MKFRFTSENLSQLPGQLLCFDLLSFPFPARKTVPLLHVAIYSLLCNISSNLWWKNYIPEWTHSETDMSFCDFDFLAYAHIRLTIPINVISYLLIFRVGSLALFLKFYQTDQKKRFYQTTKINRLVMILFISLAYFV